MLKNKILLKISGSIAAYKAAYLTSKLVQNGYDVKVVMSDAALKFIGSTTFEALTAHNVYTDMFAKGETLNHINLIKWADLIIVVPATANTINRFANGDGSTLLSALFLAHDFSKPYLIAPAMNTKMFQHPATQEGIEKLKLWGVEFLLPESGYLACGDTGIGKLLEPDKIFEEIKKRLTKKEKNISVLITSGGTRESIDGVRFIANMSTGNTGATIAEYFITKGYDVTFVHSKNSTLPNNICKNIEYESFNDLQKITTNKLSQNNYDVVIHLAAVSDYSVEGIEFKDNYHTLPLIKKIKSDTDNMKLHLKRNSKIINQIKNISKNKNIILVGFKLVKGSNQLEKMEAVNSLFDSSKADLIVLNDFADRKDSKQNNFSIIGKEEEIVNAEEAKTLSIELEKLIIKIIKKESYVTNN